MKFAPCLNGFVATALLAAATFTSGAPPGAMADDAVCASLCVEDIRSSRLRVKFQAKDGRTFVVSKNMVKTNKPVVDGFTVKPDTKGVIGAKLGTSRGYGDGKR